MDLTTAPDIFESLGKVSGCLALARHFYGHVAQSLVLKPLFPGKSLRCASEEFAAFLIQLFSGDPSKTQYRWWLSIRASHERFQITDEQRAAWLGAMTSTLDDLYAGTGSEEALKQFFHVGAAYVVGADEGLPQHPGLQDGWRRQLLIDDVMTALERGDYAGSLTLLSKVDCGPSIKVGMLARFMETRHPDLIKFVEEEVGRHSDLATGRFNGRTLLHFSASAGCLSVVRRLLQAGADPNCLDDRGFPPLYRAADGPDDDGSEAVVQEFVRAGADVDRRGGVHRCTPLHAAARKGILHVTKALLAAGADPWIEDKNGTSALDRARNCRKWQVLEFLQARSSPQADPS